MKIHYIFITKDSSPSTRTNGWRQPYPASHSGPYGGLLNEQPQWPPASEQRGHCETAPSDSFQTVARFVNIALGTTAYPKFHLTVTSDLFSAVNEQIMRLLRIRALRFVRCMKLGGSSTGLVPACQECPTGNGGKASNRWVVGLNWPELGKDHDLRSARSKIT